MFDLKFFGLNVADGCINCNSRLGIPALLIKVSRLFSKYQLISNKSNTIKEISHKSFDITVFNKNAAGFYKTIYPKTLHNKLISELKKNINTIPSEERLGLLSDTYILLKANKISPEYYLNLLPAFMNENNPYIWKYLCGSLRAIDLKLYETSLYKNYFSYISDLLNNINIKIDWNFDNISSETEQLMKATLLENLSYYQNKDITTKATSVLSTLSFIRLKEDS